MDQLDTWRKESPGLRMRNLVHERLARVHRNLVARLQIVEPHVAVSGGTS
jgi:hypothetical protein